VPDSTTDSLERKDQNQLLLGMKVASTEFKVEVGVGIERRRTPMQKAPPKSLSATQGQGSLE